MKLRGKEQCGDVNCTERIHTWFKHNCEKIQQNIVKYCEIMPQLAFDTQSLLTCFQTPEYVSTKETKELFFRDQPKDGIYFTAQRNLPTCTPHAYYLCKKAHY